MSWKDVFAFMHNLDNKSTSYKHEAVMVRPVFKLYNCRAQLLVYSLQQPLQSHTSYNLLGEDEVPTEAEVTV